MKHILAVLLASVALSLAASAQTCSTFPCVVASVTLTDQNQAIRGTPIFTPTSDGIFRISIYISTSNGHDPSGKYEIFWDWTDLNGPKEQSLTVFRQQGQSYTSIVRDIANVPIRYRVKAHYPDGMTYNLNIVVEQLQ